MIISYVLAALIFALAIAVAMLHKKLRSQEADFNMEISDLRAEFKSELDGLLNYVPLMIKNDKGELVLKDNEGNEIYNFKLDKK